MEVNSTWRAGSFIGLGQRQEQQVKRKNPLGGLHEVVRFGIQHDQRILFTEPAEELVGDDLETELLHEFLDLKL